MASIIAILVLIVLLFFLKDIVRMKKMQSDVRTVYIEEGLTYDRANKVALYLIDMFNYMRKNKDPKLVNMVINSTMTVFRQRLYKNDAYEGNLTARMQVEDIRDACLVFHRPVIEAADLMYSSVVSNHEEDLRKQKSA